MNINREDGNTKKDTQKKKMLKCKQIKMGTKEIDSTSQKMM